MHFARRCSGVDLSRPSGAFSCPFKWFSDVHWKDFLTGGQRCSYPKDAIVHQVDHFDVQIGYVQLARNRELALSLPARS